MLEGKVIEIELEFLIDGLTTKIILIGVFAFLWPLALFKSSTQVSYTTLITSKVAFVSIKVLQKCLFLPHFYHILGNDTSEGRTAAFKGYIQISVFYASSIYDNHTISTLFRKQ